MDCRLRPATDSDKAFLFSLHCATMREAIEKTWGWDEEWQRNSFEERFRAFNVSLIEACGRGVGSLWTEQRPDAVYIAELQVLPPWQGRGIGTTILQHVVADAASRGVPVELAVLQVNPRAQRLYERLGFKVTAEGTPFIRMRHDVPAPETG